MAWGKLPILTLRRTADWASWRASYATLSSARVGSLRSASRRSWTGSLLLPSAAARFCCCFLRRAAAALMVGLGEVGCIVSRDEGRGE